MSALKTLKLFHALANNEIQKVTITALSPCEAEIYSSKLDTPIEPGSRLIVTANSYRHLKNSAHITGQGKKSTITDSDPLDENDIKELIKVFKKPDRLYWRRGRVVAEKSLSKNHRLVMQLQKSGKQFQLITYFNITKKPPEREISD